MPEQEPIRLTASNYISIGIIAGMMEIELIRGDRRVKDVHLASYV